MAIKNLEDFKHDVEVSKELLASMPINNAKNLVLYKNKVAELKNECEVDSERLYNEIKRRCQKYLSYTPSDRTNIVTKELKNYKELSIFSKVNTPFEKLGLDTLLYSITHYYDNDLMKVNADIKKTLEIFRLAGVPLTESDFIYSNYAKRYISELLSNDDADKMKDVFEDLHWKCPDVISHVETSLRIIYSKNIKKFEAYIEIVRKDILGDSLSFEDYLIRRGNLLKELETLKYYGEDVLVNRFLTGELVQGDYNTQNLNKCYATFLGNVSLEEAKLKNSELVTLKQNLLEQSDYLRFEFILKDAKAKYEERASHTGETARITKEINAIVDELARLSKEIEEKKGKGFLFFKKKVDIEQNYLQINEKVRELDLKYKEYDDALLYEKMNEHLNDTSSILDLFKFAYGFKKYLRECIKSHDDTADLAVVKEMVTDYESFIYNPDIAMINNIAFTTDTDLSMVLMDHYNVLQIKIPKEELTIDGIEGLVKSINVIINNSYLDKYELTIDYIINIFEAKKIVDIKKKTSEEE